MSKSSNEGRNQSDAPPAKATHRFTVHLGGLISLLSDALYTSENVFIRELIQNSVDAITARRLNEPGWQGMVHIQVFKGDDSRLRLSVEDNGIGLTEAEVHEFLATIGASMKRSDLEQRRSEGFLGQFGVGFLSCFLVADEVTLITRRAGVADAKTLEWHGCKDGTYTLMEVTGERPPGSSVYLTLKEDTRDVYDAERLLKLARKYAGYLTDPIDFTSSETQKVRVNAVPFPWLRENLRRGTQQKEWLEFAEKMLATKFLAAFPVECAEGGIRGMACVLREPVGALDVAQHTVFLKGMFLSREIEGVVPREMSFLRCIVNATGLKPNASRECLQDAEESLRAMRESVARSLVRFLTELEEEDPRLLEEIMRVHNRSFLELAAQDSGIIKIISPHLRFETSLGERTLSELVEATVFYIDSYEDFKRAELFAATHNIMVLNAGYAGVGRLMESLALEMPRGKFQNTTARELKRLMTRGVELSGALRTLQIRAQVALRSARVGVCMSADPRGREAATVEVPERESLRRSGARRAPDFITESFFDEMETSGDVVLNLNTSHPLVQLLCDPELPDSRLEAMIWNLYYNALICAREVPTPFENDIYYRSLEFFLGVGAD